MKLKAYVKYSDSLKADDSIDIKTAYVEPDEDNVYEYVSDEIFRKTGKVFKFNDFKITNLQDIIDDLNYI